MIALLCAHNSVNCHAVICLATYPVQTSIQCKPTNYCAKPSDGQSSDQMRSGTPGQKLNTLFHLTPHLLPTIGRNFGSYYLLSRSTLPSAAAVVNPRDGSSSPQAVAAALGTLR